MKFKYVYALLTIACFSSQASNIDEEFNTAVVDVTAVLEVVNTLGKRCNQKLDALGFEGTQSKECSKYMKSHQDGGILYTVSEPCKTVSKWYSSKQSFIMANPNYAQEHKTEALELIKNMKWAHQHCPPRNPKGYDFIYKPMKKIKLLSQSN